MAELQLYETPDVDIASLSHQTPRSSHSYSEIFKTNTDTPSTAYSIELISHKGNHINMQRTIFN